jgi:hypothetical protein
LAQVAVRMRSPDAGRLPSSDSRAYPISSNACSHHLLQFVPVGRVEVVDVFHVSRRAPTPCPRGVNPVRAPTIDISAFATVPHDHNLLHPRSRRVCSILQDAARSAWFGRDPVVEVVPAPPKASQALPSYSVGLRAPLLLPKAWREMKLHYCCTAISVPACVAKPL